MSHARKIAKNILCLIIAQIITLISSVILASLLARTLLPESYGKYTFAFSLTAIFAIFIDLGLNTLIIRDISRQKKVLGRYINNILTMQIVSSVLMSIGLFVCINLLNYPKDTTYAVYIIGLAVVITSFSSIVGSIFRAFEQMQYESIIETTKNLAFLALSAIFLLNGYGLITVCFIFLFTTILQFLFYWRVYIKKFSKPRLEFNFDFWKYLIKTGFSFAITGIFVVIYGRISTIMLSLMLGDSAVGLYNAPYNLIVALSFIPGAFLASIFPVLSAYFVSSKETLKKAYYLSFKYLLTISVPLVIGIFILSEKIILLIFGQEYLQSTIVLKILIWIQLFAFISWLMGIILNSAEKQKLFAYATGSGVIVNIVLNFFLIPQFGIKGAAFATLITQITVFSVLLYFIYTGVYKVKLWKILIKPAISAIIMAGFILLFYKISLIVIIPASIIIYFLALYLIKGFSEEDKEVISSILKNEK